MPPQNNASIGYQIARLPTAAEEISDGSILSQTLHSSERLKAIVFTFAPGTELSEHTSSHAATLHFLSGKAQVTLGADTVTAEPGTWVSMDPHLPHSIRAETAVVMLLEMMVSP